MKTINLILLAMLALMIISCEPEDDKEFEELAKTSKETEKEKEEETETENNGKVNYKESFDYALAIEAQINGAGIHSITLTETRIVIIMDIRVNGATVAYSDFDYALEITYHDSDYGIVEGFIKWDGDSKKGLEAEGDTGEFRYEKGKSFTLRATVESGEYSEIYMYN